MAWPLLAVCCAVDRRLQEADRPVPALHRSAGASAAAPPGRIRPWHGTGPPMRRTLRWASGRRRHSVSVAATQRSLIACTRVQGSLMPLAIVPETKQPRSFVLLSDLFVMVKVRTPVVPSCCVPLHVNGAVTRSCCRACSWRGRQAEPLALQPAAPYIVRYMCRAICVATCFSNRIADPLRVCASASA